MEREVLNFAPGKLLYVITGLEIRSNGAHICRDIAIPGHSQGSQKRSEILEVLQSDVVVPRHSQGNHKHSEILGALQSGSSLHQILECSVRTVFSCCVCPVYTILVRADMRQVL